MDRELGIGSNKSGNELRIPAELARSLGDRLVPSETCLLDSAFPGNGNCNVSAAAASITIIARHTLTKLFKAAEEKDTAAANDALQSDFYGIKVFLGKMNISTLFTNQALEWIERHRDPKREHTAHEVIREMEEYHRELREELFNNFSAQYHDSSLPDWRDLKSFASRVEIFFDTLENLLPAMLRRCYIESNIAENRRALEQKPLIDRHEDWKEITAGLEAALERLPNISPELSAGESDAEPEVIATPRVTPNILFSLTYKRIAQYARNEGFHGTFSLMRDHVVLSQLAHGDTDQGSDMSLETKLPLGTLKELLVGIALQKPGVLEGSLCPEVIRREILRPVGMVSTGFHESSDDPLAHGYTTVGDMQKLALALNNNTLLQSAETEKLLGLDGSASPMGLKVRSAYGVTRVTCGEASEEQFALLDIYPKSGHSCIFLGRGKVQFVKDVRSWFFSEFLPPVVSKGI